MTEPTRPRFRLCLWSFTIGAGAMSFAFPFLLGLLGMMES